MNWFFPSNDGGQEYGFHDAGVETFRGNLNRYIARESIQNGIDARREKNVPVIIKFEKTSFKASQHGWMAELKTRFDSCAEYLKTDKEGRAFFQKGAKLIQSGEITVLKISDSNTTGVLAKMTNAAKAGTALLNPAVHHQKAAVKAVHSASVKTLLSRQVR